MEMTREEAIKIMENEVRCVRNPNCERLECRNCYLVMPEHTVLKAYEVAIKALEQEPCEDLIIEWKKDFKRYVNSLSMPRDDYKGIMEYIDELPVNPQQKIGRWVYRIYGQFHEEGNWHCSGCDYIFNGGYGHAEYCPKCGCEMSEAPTEEVKRI